MTIPNMMTTMMTTSTSLTTLPIIKNNQNLKQPIPSSDATVGQVSTIKPNQRVNVSATLSLEEKKPKPVMFKSTQKNSSVKEDCILEDETGAILFHIWSPLIDQVQTNK
ncbi:hypothetical protein ACROYT_G015479 [Oculina patagonica]